MYIDRRHESTPAWLRATRYAIAAVILIAILFGYQIVKLYTDWLWFGELGQPRVYSGMLSAKLTLFFGFGILFFLISYTNFWVAQRLSASRPLPRGLDPEREQISRIARQATRWVALIAAVFIAFIVGGNAAQQWPDYLQFTHAGRFGITDPVFHNDVGFYMFRLPFLGFLINWALITVGITAVGVALIHYGSGALDFLATNVPTFAPYVRRHLLSLLGLFALIYAFSYMIGRYDLLYSDNGVFYGAGYTDLHVRLPVIYWQMAAMAITGVLCFLNIWQGRAFRLPIVGLAVWVLVSIVGAGLIPGAVERFSVVPNQFDKEKEYIARDLQFTQRAYGLDHVKEEPFGGSKALTASALAADRPTIDNIRLWDWPELGLVYTAKQALATYYRFTLPANATMTSGDYNIDVDRYRIGGQMRQVMLGVRELYIPGLPDTARTWQNERLQYTHGYGIVMSPVNRVDPQGLPDYYVSQIPLESSTPDIKVARPQIYYGELTDQYAFVGTKQDEFDYHSGNGDVTTRYTGRGGSPLSSSLARLAWSIRLGDTNMLLSSDLTSSSRILFRRAIRERVQTLAPFLNWDNDPYMVDDDGHLVWIMDAYTVSDRYPYAKPFSAGTPSAEETQDFNYIRNSVKAVVDAYDGTVTLYVADPADPIIRTWNRIFPTLFTPMAQMSPTLLAHRRYPEDLFRIQRDMYTLYHITDPRIYYNKEDAWEVPADPTPQNGPQSGDFTGGQTSPMQPYYVVMRLPGQTSEEFLIMTPFTPLRRQNLSGWMCARCDPANYGQLIVYRFPRGMNVNGPQQIIGQINQQPDISQRRTLLGQQGSQVIFGNLLVIPVESSLLYAVPLYVQSNTQGGAAIPQIQYVITASADQISMDTTLDRAIADLGQGATLTASAPSNGGPAATGAAPPPSSTAPTATALPQRPASVQELLRRANTAYTNAKKRQQEYGRSLDDLGRALQDLQRSLGAPHP